MSGALTTNNTPAEGPQRGGPEAGRGPGKCPRWITPRPIRDAAVKGRQQPSDNVASGSFPRGLLPVPSPAPKSSCVAFPFTRSRSASRLASSPQLSSPLAGRRKAGTAVRMTLEEAFQRSELVLEGTVVGASCGEDARGVIYTDWAVDVDRTFWGADDAQRTVRLPGGVLASGKGMVVPGMPRLSVGEDVVLLMGAASPAGLRLPTGLSQGKYRIVTSTDGERVQSGEHVSLVTGQRTRAANGLDMMPFSDLVARLEAQAQARRAAANEEGR